MSYLIKNGDPHLESDPGDDGSVEVQVQEDHVLAKPLLGQLCLVDVVLCANG